VKYSNNEKLEAHLCLSFRMEEILVSISIFACVKEVASLHNNAARSLIDSLFSTRKNSQEYVVLKAECMLSSQKGVSNDSCLRFDPINASRW
jgi:hypothetical protein